MISSSNTKKNDNSSSKGGRTRRLFSRILPVKTWSDWSRTKMGLNFLLEKVKLYFVPGATVPKASRKKIQQLSNQQQAFREAQARLNLTDDDLKDKQKSLRLWNIIMLVIALFIFTYIIYHLMLGTTSGALLSSAVLCISLALAFRFHFWFFQIRERRLGVTFMQWFQEGLLGGRK